MRKVLIIYAHPFSGHSKANKTLIQSVRGLEGVAIHDLYEVYPNFVIHVEREKKLVEAHDTIVFQHPIYWYNMPSLVKEWLDRVLELGWAYGEGAKALKGKELLCAVTSGGSSHAYSSQGQNLFELPDLLRSYELTAKLCGMHYLRPFIVHRAPTLSDTEIQEHGHRYRERIQTLTQDYDRATDNSQLRDAHETFSTHTKSLLGDSRP